MKVIFGSVIYQEALKYLNDFFESLECQTEKSFEILLINDDIPEEKLQEQLKNHPLLLEQVIVINHEKKKYNYQLRIRLLKEAYQRGADLLILGDCDDKFSADRIEKHMQAYDKGYAFFYNKLLDWNGQEVMPTIPKNTRDIMDIGEKNYLGLSNTSINMKQISLSFIDSLNNGKTSIFDWYLYSRILLNGGKGKYVNVAITYYRIHAQNLAGRTNWSKENINKEINVKLDHYQLLKQYHPYLKKMFILYSNINKEDIERYTICQEKNYWWGLINMERKSDV